MRCHYTSVTTRMIPKNYQSSDHYTKDYGRKESFELVNPKYFDNVCSSRRCDFMETSKDPTFSINCTWLIVKKKCRKSCFKFQIYDRENCNRFSIRNQNSKISCVKNSSSNTKIGNSSLESNPNLFFKDLDSTVSTGSDILTSIKSIFKHDFTNDNLYQFISSNERVDCQCHRPCDVPSSQSVVDVRNMLEEVESGDDLDKMESDTDSQDTVIEGEAYKRMRNVAIKEKILLANEEVFGSNDQCINAVLASKVSSFDKIKLPVESKVKEILHEPVLEPKTTMPVLPIISDSEELDSFSLFSSLGRNFLPFKSEIFCSPLLSSTKDSLQLQTINESGRDASIIPFSDSVCSSESSDNGSDGEEVNLSDTSTSSDEATFNVPWRGSQSYNFSATYKLHTILEESSEENEISLKNSSSDSEHFNMSNCVSVNASKFSKTCESNMLHSSADFDEGIGDSMCVALPVPRYKFSKSNQNTITVTVPDDSMTDESGEVSSDEDLSSVKVKRNSKNDPGVKKKSRKLLQTSPTSSIEVSLKRCSKTDVSNPSQNQSSKSDLDHNEIEESKQAETQEHVSDDEAKYIMNHLMMHISNENCYELESPMIKELESEIVRLMLTVSPASLSAGSSCSSTIGSNNSDYGSDTLESAEESISNEDENAENQIVVNDSSPKNEQICENSETLISEPTVSEETLYICKKLMASLKKITVTSDIECLPEEMSMSNEDNSAKQYITDQIVTLMQTVNASQNNSPLFCSSYSPTLLVDSQDPSDSDSSPNGEKAGHLKSKTPSESGSETTISASISIPSYDDSDRTPTESEISHEMDELYALLERSNTPQDLIFTSKDLNRLSSFDDESNQCVLLTETCGFKPEYSQNQSLLFEGSSELDSILPISFEERIARYKDAFLSLKSESEEYMLQSTETLINVELPQTCISENIDCNKRISNSLPLNLNFISKSESDKILLVTKSFDNILSNPPIASDKNISISTYPLSIHVDKITTDSINFNKNHSPKMDFDEECEKNVSSTVDVNHHVVSDSKVLSLSNIAKEKASSENDLLVANYRSKSKSNKVFGTKSAGNICELENLNIKSPFRDTGYYSFKSSGDSFLSLDDSTASQTSLSQHRSLTSSETIPEEEEPSVVPKMSLSSGNIPDALCDPSASKCSTLPLSLRGKLSCNPRTRSSFFSTSGVLRKLTLLRDESGSAPRLRMRNRSGGSDDGRQRKLSGPDCLDLERDSFQDDQSYQSRSHLSLSSFGGRSESITSVYSAAGGGRYGTVSVTGDVLFGCNYNSKTSVLEITVKECRNLAPVDVKRNRSDPYVKVYLLPDRTKSGKRKTKVKKHTLNPRFDELLKFQVPFTELAARTLWLSVWHSDRFGRNDFLGEVMLSLGNQNSGLDWYPLQEKLDPLDNPVGYKGDLILALKYSSPDSSVLMKGTLEVLIRQARNLMATRSNGTSDPFCKSYLLPDKSKAGKQKTPVIKKSCNPQWNHTFKYEDLSQDDLKERCLELTIWDYDKITSNDFLGGVRLCLGTGKHRSKEVDWMDSEGEEQSLWYTMLERPNAWVEGSLLLRANMQSRN